MISYLNRTQPTANASRFVGCAGLHPQILIPHALARFWLGAVVEPPAYCN